MKTPTLSIVIPCYNSEETLEETLTSVLNQSYDQWEAIIVNDGSPDNLELIALNWVDKDERFRYYKKENGGLGSARNYGIERASGKYILPLDSDNKVRLGFAEKAIRFLEEHPEVGVVHGDAVYFGDKSGLWKVKQFNLEQILIKNYIDACAIFRKNLWIAVGGYDTEIPYQGNEDWDLWLAFGVHKVVFKHLEEITFDYRVTETSMIKSFNTEMFKENKDYIYNKYSELYFQYFNKTPEPLANNKKPLAAKIEFLKKWIKNLINF